MVIDNILDFIGNTPILKANKVVDDNMAQLYVKLEKKIMML